MHRMVNPTLCIVFAGACLAGDLAAAERSGPEAAREQLQAMKVADGLEVTLFASEPMVRNPAGEHTGTARWAAQWQPRRTGSGGKRRTAAPDVGERE